MNIKLCLYMIILLLVTNLFSGYTKVLKELTNPAAIYIDNKNIYISEGTSVYIYSLKNFSLINVFGSNGEGPGEFKNKVGKIVILKDKILINSFERISYFSKNGNFLKSNNTGRGIPKLNFFQLNTGFIGLSLEFKGMNSFFSINIFDKKFNKKKMLLKIQQTKSGKYLVLSPILAINSYFVYRNKIYILGKDSSEIAIYNTEGIKLTSFKHNFAKIKLNKDETDIFYNIMKRKISDNKKIIERIQFPTYYPEIVMLHVSNDIIYIVGWSRVGGKLKHYIRCFDLEGKLIFGNYINLGKQDIDLVEPFTFDNWILYQLKENKNENWELHVSSIK